MSAKSAETYARSVQAKGISLEEKIDRLARAMVELARAIAAIESNILSMR